MTAEEASSEAKKRLPVLKFKFRIPKSARITAGIVIMLFVFFNFLLPDLSNAHKSLNRLEHVNIGVVLAGVAIEILSLLAYAQLTHTVLSPRAPSRFRLFRINMSSLAVSHVLPGGTAAGATIAYRLLGDSGVSASAATFGLATQGVGSAAVLNVLFWSALLISIPLHGYNPLYGFAGLAGVILLAAFGGSIYLLIRGQKGGEEAFRRTASHIPFVDPDAVAKLVLNVADHLRGLLNNRPLLIRALLWAMLNWILDATSLYIFVGAFGRWILPINLLVAYGLANILAVIPITPGGLGVVEAVSIASLVGFGVPARIAILAVLAWRLVNFWLPIPFGGLSYLSLKMYHDGEVHSAPT